MPQPLKQWTDDIQFTKGALTARPAFAMLIANVAAAWSEIEVDMGLALAIILNTEARTGVAMYLALSGSAAQDRSLDAAVQTLLPAELQAEFSQLLAEMRRRGKERNRVIHALWSEYPNDAAKIINCSPDNIVRDVAKSFHAKIKREEVFLTEPSQEFIANLLVYSERDFSDIMQRSQELRDKIQAFALKVDTFHQQQNQPTHGQAQQPPTQT
jgi:hypothetical protein